MIQSGNIITAFGGTKDAPKTVSGLVFRDNLVRHNEFGVIGTGPWDRDQHARCVLPRRGVRVQHDCRRAGGEVPEGERVRQRCRLQPDVRRLRRRGLPTCSEQPRPRSGIGRQGSGADMAAIAQALGTPPALTRSRLRSTYRTSRRPRRTAGRSAAVPAPASRQAGVEREHVGADIGAVERSRRAARCSPTPGNPRRRRS